MNKEWHRKNRMPKNASREEKLVWHTGHAKHCSCRDSASHILKLKEKLKIDTKSAGAWKICNRGHRYAGSGPCPVCWPGSKRRLKIKR